MILEYRPSSEDVLQRLEEMKSQITRSLPGSDKGGDDETTGAEG